jgi:hypothetical protein
VVAVGLLEAVGHVHARRRLTVEAEIEVAIAPYEYAMSNN